MKMFILGFVSAPILYALFVLFAIYWQKWLWNRETKMIKKELERQYAEVARKNSNVQRLKGKTNHD